MDDLLLARIREAPDDDGPRLVLADALLERGDVWGELIVLSCKVAQLAAPMQAELLDKVFALRKTRWPTEAFVGTIARGFYDRVWARDVGVREVVGPEFALMRELRVRNITDAGLHALAEIAPRVDTLKLEHELGSTSKQPPPVSGELAVRALANVSCRALTLRRVELAREDLHALFAAPIATGLRELEIANRRLSGILDGLAWPPLDALALCFDLQSADVAAVLQSPQLHDLRALSFAYNAIDDDAARVIASTPFRRLAALELQSTSIGDDGIALLASAPQLHAVTRLAIARHHEAEPIVDSIPRLAAFTAVTDLRIDFTTSAAALAELYANLSAPLDKLEARVSGVEGVDCLPRFELPAFRALRILDLSYQPLGDAGAIAIANVDLPRLHKLDLAGCKIGPDGALALARSTTLPRTLELGLYGNDVGEHADALRARYRDVSLG